MTATQNTTANALPVAAQAPAVKPVAIVYEVKTHNKGRVTVTSDYGYRAARCRYSCDCGGYKLYGGCSHLDAVQAERAKQGRK